MEHLFSISNYANGYCPNILNTNFSSLSDTEKIKRLQSSIQVNNINKPYLNNLLMEKYSKSTSSKVSTKQLVFSFFCLLVNQLEFTFNYFQNLQIDSNTKSILLSYYTEHISINKISETFTLSTITINRIITIYTKEAIEEYERTIANK